MYQNELQIFVLEIFELTLEIYFIIYEIPLRSPQKKYII